MKKSRILFISYFSAIGLFLIGFTIMGFVYSDKSSDDFKRNHYVEISEDLASFKHIYVDKNCDVNIKSSEQAYFSYAHKKGEKTIKPVFRVRNDTLYVEHTDKRITIYFARLQSISGNHCEIRLKSTDLDQLSIHLKRANLRIWDNVNIAKLKVDLEESSNVSGWNFKTKQLVLDIDNSEFNVNSNVKLELAKGTIRNNSSICISPAKSIQLELDESSQLQIH